MESTYGTPHRGLPPASHLSPPQYVVTGELLNLDTLSLVLDTIHVKKLDLGEILRRTAAASVPEAVQYPRETYLTFSGCCLAEMPSDRSVSSFDEAG